MDAGLCGRGGIPSRKCRLELTASVDRVDPRTAMMDDRDAVLEANGTFYRAFESLDLARMERVWLRAPYIKCIHPGWGRLVGWGPVMESWQRLFDNTLGMRFTLTDVCAEVLGDLGWVVLTENVESRYRDGAASVQVEATNVFQRHEGRWFVVHHHGSPVYTPATPAGSERMH